MIMQKIFYNEDGDAYAVEDLTAGDADNTALVDSYDVDDEKTIYALAGDDVDLEDADYVILKDGVEI